MLESAERAAARARDVVAGVEAAVGAVGEGVDEAACAAAVAE